MSSERVVFLGDSNTFAGGYIHEFETAILKSRGQCPEIINMGLPSETCSGLSEPAHPFPRPDVHERLSRVIEKTKPDLVVACYGINDAIYHPFSKSNFEKFKDGIKRLINTLDEANVPLVLLTPPPFDPLPMKKRGLLQEADAEEFSWSKIYKNYDSEVIRRYAEWMKTLDSSNCLVVDIYTPIAADLAKRRQTNPDYSYSNDGVHINADGHRVLAESIAAGLEIESFPNVPSLLSPVAKRSNIMRQAWLSHVGHNRPGVKPGLSLEEAHEKIKAASKQIENQLYQR